MAFNKLLKKILHKNSTTNTQNETIIEDLPDDKWSEIESKLDNFSLVKTESIKELSTECQRLREIIQQLTKECLEKDERIKEAMKIIDDQNAWFEYVVETVLKKKELELLGLSHIVE